MLYVVSTPIGNLGDLTDRARRVLGAVETVLAEDTRVTGKLLAYIGARPRLERFDEHTSYGKIPHIIQRLKDGEEIALVSDAGTPGISDPGKELIDAVLSFDRVDSDYPPYACSKSSTPLADDNSIETDSLKAAVQTENENELRDYRHQVTVVPGPSAVVAAMTASGLKSDAFYFGGFLPRKSKAQRDALQALTTLDATLIFYESPKRLVRTLENCANVLGSRRGAVVRELTKLHEEVVRAPLPELAVTFAARDTIKGEIVIVIEQAMCVKIPRVHKDKYEGLS